MAATNANAFLLAQCEVNAMDGKDQEAGADEDFEGSSHHRTGQITGAAKSKPIVAA